MLLKIRKRNWRKLHESFLKKLIIEKNFDETWLIQRLYLVRSGREKSRLRMKKKRAEMDDEQKENSKKKARLRRLLKFVIRNRD